MSSSPVSGWKVVVAFLIGTCVWDLSQGIAQNNDGSRKVIVCSTTQVADFARQVVGDRWEVRCVLGAGEDPHTYRPGNDDALDVAAADLCIENGWHLEGNEWMKTLAETAGKPIVTCIQGVASIEYEYEGQMVRDPHAWFNPRNAWIYTKTIRDAVIKLDPEHRAEYERRAELYRMQLLSLNQWITRQVNDIPEARRVLITHHDAFGYFCRQYRFKAFSPVGWTTSELAGISLEARQEIVKQIGELGVKSIFVETSINSETLEGIARDAGVSIGGKLYSDAMGAEGSAAETYLGMMRENVITIVSALK